MEDRKLRKEDITVKTVMAACSSCQWGKQDKRLEPCINCCFDGIHGTMYVQAEDKVNHPAHYTGCGIECIDAIKLICMGRHWTSELSYFVGNIVKYLWRHKDKGGLEDLQKAKWYCYKAIGICEDSEVLQMLCELTEETIDKWEMEHGEADKG